MKGKAVYGGGRDEGKGSWGGWVGEQELSTAREVEQNLQGRGEKHQVGNRTNYFPIRKHTSFLPTTPLNSCSPTANKTVLFASGFWPRAVSAAALPAGTDIR